MVYGARDQSQVIAGECDIRRLDRCVGAGGSHGDSDVGRGERGGVVDAVSDHRHWPPAVGTQLGDCLRLVLRTQLGTHVGDPRLDGQCISGAGVVAGKHRHAHTPRRQRRHGLAGLWTQLVAHPDGPDRVVVAVDDHHGDAAGLHRVNVICQRTWVEPARAADGDVRAIDKAGDSRARGLGDRRCGGDLGSCGGDRCGQRVGAVGFQSGRPAQDLVLGSVASGEDLRDGGLVSGQGAGLVHCHMPEVAHALERGTGFDDHPELAGRTDRGDDRNRHRDRQCARRSGDQYHQCSLDPQSGISEDRADQGDQSRQDENTRHQRAGQAVGDTCPLPLLCLCLLNQFDHCGHGIVCSCGGGLDLQDAGGVDRAGQHRVTGSDLDGNGFTRDRRDIQAALSDTNDPVGGQAFAGDQTQHIAAFQRLNGHVAGGAEDGGTGGDQGQQSPQA